MIVRQGFRVLHVMTQPDHAAAARIVMEQWEPLGHHQRRESILLAIGEHDNGWRELDAAPSVDSVTGRIFDFMTLPVEQRQAVWPRGIGRLATRDTWAAALVARHAAFVYNRHRRDTQWSAFFAEMERCQNDLTLVSRATSRDLEADYRFVRIGDLISLTFCAGVTWEEHDGWTFRLDGNSVIVPPNTLQNRTVSISVMAHEIADIPYRSDADLRAALESARRIRLDGQVSESA